MQNFDKDKNLVQKVKSSEQIISMVMGVLVVLAIGGLAYRYFQTKGFPQLPQITQENQDQEDQGEEGDGEEGEETEGKESQEMDMDLPQTHSVAQNENLWNIAETYYLSGYNWVDIAEANNLANPDQLAVGQELTIPNVDQRQITVTQLPETGIADDIEITGDSYTVQEGDSLSKIALRTYGDMFAWPKIWGANRDQISNPNLIEPGMELEIPQD